ncbi:unnamed protein product [Symbiodinium necroappetens]|uniref:FHA domain-containing protein n=1 Tax=Symbiodinium necroappetens TaxID=1628268 RepID=A0A812IZH9_9DINO|nr:unnamed protein product [Symbiodinium necroappetens]
MRLAGLTASSSFVWKSISDRVRRLQRRWAKVRARERARRSVLTNESARSSLNPEARSRRYLSDFFYRHPSKYQPGEDDDVKCALVEYVRGIKARKWTLQLGQTYDVGRAGMNGASLPLSPEVTTDFCRAQAITQVDSELILVALDHGSTNGTFINKSRLEKDGIWSVFGTLHKPSSCCCLLLRQWHC